MNEDRTHRLAALQAEGDRLARAVDALTDPADLPALARRYAAWCRAVLALAAPEAPPILDERPARAGFDC